MSSMLFKFHFLCFVMLAIGQHPPSDTDSKGFWISVELMTAQFRKGCLSSALCHQPAFKLSQVMTLNGQQAVMSWPVEGGADTLLQKESHQRQFVAHWPLGEPEDISIQCQIAGTDPSFGFARVCDETPGRRLFQEQIVRRTVMNGVNEHQQDGKLEESEENSLLVQMRGRCFNATLAVRKHTQRCPWCPDPNVDIQVVGGTAGTGLQSELQSTQKGDDGLELHNALILALTGAVVFSLTGFACALCAHWRYRKRHGRTASTSCRRGTAPSCQPPNKKKRILKLVSPTRAQRSLPISPLGNAGGIHLRQQDHGEHTLLYGGHQQQTEEQSRYDVPWDSNKFCLVPRHWVVNGGCHQSDASSAPSLAFSGGIEPLGGTEQYATCAEFCGGRNSTLTASRPPPPPPPFSTRHSQHQQLPHPQMGRPQQQQPTFSPNTSGNSNSSSFGIGRHDDSGLDSV